MKSAKVARKLINMQLWLWKR